MRLERLHSNLAGLGLAAAAAVLLTAQSLDPDAGEPPALQSDTGPDLAAPLDPRTALPSEAGAWVDETLAAMSLEQRAGQVLMVRAYGEYYAADAPTRRRLIDQVRDLALGGVILFRSEAYAAAALVEDAQAAAAEAGSPPLLIAADFEWGAEFRIGGAVPYPTAMAIGAVGDPEMAAWMGAASARDARALGIHWIFAPVADVNVNPRNPVINVRSFGEDPGQVGKLVAAFVRAAQEGGVLATAKHFPGHGDTAVDSHIDVPILRVDSRRLQSVELAPFRAAIDAGVGSIMTAHLSVPAVTASETLPATLSPAVLTELLRNELGFAGLVVTDAMEMGGINRHWWSGQAAVKALAAGADMVLLPPFPEAVRAAIVRAVEAGELPQQRLDDAVRRVLAVKARLGLHSGSRAPALAELPRHFAPVADAARAREVSDAAVTLLRDRDAVLPLDARRPARVLVVGVSDSDTPVETGSLAAALRRDLEDVTARGIDGRSTGDEAAEILAQAARADLLVMAVRVRVRSYQERIRLPEAQERYAGMLARLDVPVVVVALGSPYAISAFPDAGAAVVAYGWGEPLQEAVASALLGKIPWRGRLPVTLPGLYPLGYGLERPAHDARLRRAPWLDSRVVSDLATARRTGAGESETPGGAARPDSPEPDREPAEKPAAEALSAPGELDSTPLTREDLASARAVVDDWIVRGAFPGAVFAIGHRNVLVALEAAGRMSYEPDAPAMGADAIFDLASVTKVVATTTVAMRAADEGRLRLDYPVQAYVPEFVGPGKDKVTVRHLLTHTAGLPPYVQYFLDYEPSEAGAELADEIRARVYATELEAEPGSGYAYSDLGIIILGEVLTRALGQPFHEYAIREVFGPLGMGETRWNPPREWLPRIPPTEQDPWRGRLVRGEVHDENAAAMGGVSSHAGLFSTARDLAIFSQLMLNGGSYGHERLIASRTIRDWTRRQDVVANSSRGLGWDTAHPSEGWAMLSSSAYGHTGFTGTSVWIDPERELFVVLLTNRVHPSRENRQIRDARIAFHTAVVEAVDRALARERAARASSDGKARASGATRAPGFRPPAARAGSVPPSWARLAPSSGTASR